MKINNFTTRITKYSLKIWTKYLPKILGMRKQTISFYYFLLFCSHQYVLTFLITTEGYKKVERYLSIPSSCGQRGYELYRRMKNLDGIFFLQLAIHFYLLDHDNRYRKLDRCLFIRCSWGQRVWNTCISRAEIYRWMKNNFEIKTDRLFAHDLYGSSLEFKRENIQRKDVKPSESQASLGIMRKQLRAPFRFLKHHSNIVLRSFMGGPLWGSHYVQRQ